MKKTLTVYSSNRAPAQEFVRSIERLTMAGCAVIPQEGTADVTLARNLALTAAVQALRAGVTADVVLLVDDDMVFELSSVAAIATWVRGNQRAASAAYVMKDGTLAAHFVGPRWHTGLGFLALPAAQLLRIADESEPFVGKPNGGLVLEFTRSGVITRDGGRRWLGEDYYFTERLGGVDLLPMAVGHVKSVVLLPNEAKLREFLDSKERAGSHSSG